MKKELEIVVDSRESKPLWSKNVIVKKLDVGDYSFVYDGVDYSDKVAIERKNLIDLFGTLGKGHKRFKRELERAQTLKYFAIVIEGDLLQIINKDFPNSQYSKMEGEVIARILFTLHVKYGINFFLANNRVQAKRVICGLFGAWVKVHA